MGGLQRKFLMSSCKFSPWAIVKYGLVALKPLSESRSRGDGKFSLLMLFVEALDVKSL